MVYVEFHSRYLNVESLTTFYKRAALSQWIRLSL